MKKLTMMAMMALMLVSCGGSKNGGSKDGGDIEWQTYSNDNYGYSVDVPGDMTKRQTMTEDNGTIYSYDGAEGATFNRIDISGSTQFFDEEYTPEKVKEEYESWTGDIEVTTKECGADYFTYTIEGDLTEINYCKFKGTHKVVIAICYDKEHKAQLGGDVAKRVFESIKMK